jgi:uncharacterized membrane protein YsdA (DUF1294 family)
LNHDLVEADMVIQSVLPASRTGVTPRTADLSMFSGSPMQHPLLLLGLAAVCSSIAFVLYALDKRAAQKGTRRVPEATLHVWSLLGGWPGALLARRKLRHKTRKISFQIIFWLTVLLNCAAMGWLLTRVSPTGLSIPDLHGARN